MATTAKLRGSKFPDSGEEDIAAIAKQISDHAEAIYQTWKSRGLAPSEILNCHTDSQAASKFGSALTPQPQTPKSPPVVELLAQTSNLDNNNLEKLVNNFVVEDKARIAAQRQRSPAKALPSSIQFALQKFERTTSPSSDQHGVKKQQHGATSPSTTKPAISQKPQISPKPVHFRQDGNSFFADTIETIFPDDLHKPQTPKRPAYLVAAPPHESPVAAGLQTWPLKNKIVEPKRTAPTKEPNNVVGHRDDDDGDKYATMPSKNSPSYLDEVAREEERLINALKNNMIIAEDRSTPERTLHFKAKGVKKEFVAPLRELVPPVDRSPSKDELTNMSLVDYAKVRYQAAQQNVPQQRVDEPRPMETSAIVSKVRHKFESSTTSVDAPTKTAETPRWGLRTRRPMDQVPHPELTTSQRQHMRAAAADKSAAAAANPVRPFLTRGSVAERVLIFEKCPSELMLDKRSRPGLATWRNIDVNHKPQIFGRKEISPKPLPQHTTLQRHIKANRNVFIPRFYFPQGKPVLPQQIESTVQKILAAFEQQPGGIVTRETCSVLVKACDLPVYWKVPLFLAAAGDHATSIDVIKFTDFWKQMVSQCHDAASRFIYMLTRGKHAWLCPEDFIPLIQDVVDSHEGLTFLKEATEFHSRYVHTVIARIFYCVNRSWSGRISVSELRRSNLLSVLQLLEEEEDINQVTAYFSYEHFYVIYCKFWELDRDHDLFIDRQDLTRHNDHALSSRIIDRIFSGAVSRSGQRGKLHDEKMSYTEFVWFLLSEEDKMHPTAIEYWFRCMDLDGDGYLSMYELEYFYEEQMQRMESIGIETLPFEDCLCQMLDMVKPSEPGKISLGDLKRCRMTPIFFDTFFNLEKYLDHEQRDPFASQRDHDGDGHELSDWDRYAAEEYELLVAEEGGDQQDHISFDETECEDMLSTSLDMIMSSEPPDDASPSSKSNHHHHHLTNGDWKPTLKKRRDDDDDQSDDDYAQDSDECSI